jgi:hypothetical protein
LSVAWGIIAGVAYLGLINAAIVALAKFAPQAIQPGQVDTGIAHAQAGQFAGGLAPFAPLVIYGIPVAAVVVTGLGIAARFKPAIPWLALGQIVAAVLGLFAALVLFLAVVLTSRNTTEVIVALLTIVVVGVLVRVQKLVRRFYRYSPGVASLVLAALTLAYLILSSGASVSAILLQQVDTWLALLAFLLALYAGVIGMRASRRLSMGK